MINCHERKQAPNMKRIAVVTPILPVPQDMTRGRFIYETTRALSRIADVKVFLTQAQYPQMNWIRPGLHPTATAQAGYSLPDIDVETVNYPALPMVSRISNGWLAGQRLVKPMQRFAPDFVIGYWVYPEGAGAIQAARKLGKPAVLGALGTDINDRHGINAYLTRHALHGADRIIFVSNDMRNRAISEYGVTPARCATVVNGINTSVFHPQDQGACRSDLGVSPDASLIVYVGRLIEAKGLRELILATDELRKSRPETRLVIIGEGTFKEQLKTMIQDRNLTAHVQLAGGLLPHVIAKWLNAANLLTLPSWSEGYPNVLVEALACGCPVVATTVGGIPEIVTTDCGLLCPPRHLSELLSALEKGLEAHWNRNTIARGMSRTWNDVAEETLQICVELAN